MADTREILLKLLGRETISTAAKKAADGLEDLGDSADDAARDAKRLDDQLDDTERQVNDLVRALQKDPGDIALRKQLRALERESKFLSGLKKRFGDAGDDAAEGFGARLVARIGPVLGSAPISPPIIAAVAGAAPAVSALISAAVSGGAALGAVGIGAALAARRNEVGRAFSELGGDIMEGLVIDAKPLAEPLIKASQTVRSEFRKLRPEIQSIFSDAAKYVDPLTRGLTGLGRELVPGLREAVREAGPVVDVLSYKLPAAGRATSGALKAITEDSENAAAALSTLMTGAEIGIQATGNSLGILNKALPFTSGALLKVNDMLTQNDKKSAAAAAAADKQSQAESRRAQAVARSTAEIDGMNQALADAPGEALSAEQAMLQLEQAIDDANRTIKENGKATGDSSQKARDNRAALLDMAAATHRAAEAAGRQAGGQQRANEILDRGRRAFLAAAAAAGVEARAATNLANKLFGIPGARTTKINVNKQQAERDIASVNSRANSAARPRTIWFTVAQSGSLGAIGQRAEGGPVKKGQPYLVGEKGPELITPKEDGFVHTSSMTRGMMGGGRPVGASAVAVKASWEGPPGLEGDLGRALLRFVRFTVETNGGSGAVLGIRR